MTNPTVVPEGTPGRHRAPGRFSRSRSRRGIVVGTVTLASAALVLAFGVAGPASASSGPVVQSHTQTVKSTVKPTIVLVHGAFADASGWSDEVSFLERAGYPVIAPPDPLRGLTSDSDYIRSVLQTISGPIILVGHSYGGAVITNAARGVPNVKALVYISAFIPDAGDTTAYFLDQTNYPGSLLSQSTLVFRPTTNPAAGGADVDVSINPASFQAVFAGDQTASKAAILAAEQRPLSGFANGEKSGDPAWKTIPSWALVGLDDKAIPPAAQEYMANRAGAHTIEIHSAHDSLISHPGVVDALILQAANATS